jgi:hypothetical protein
MKDICPICEKVTEVKIIDREEIFNIKGEKIPVHVVFLQCQECNSEWENSKIGTDPYEVAYREYEKRTGKKVNE